MVNLSLSQTPLPKPAESLINLLRDEEARLTGVDINPRLSGIWQLPKLDPGRYFKGFGTFVRGAEARFLQNKTNDERIITEIENADLARRTFSWRMDNWAKNREHFQLVYLSVLEQFPVEKVGARFPVLLYALDPKYYTDHGWTWEYKGICTGCFHTIQETIVPGNLYTTFCVHCEQRFELRCHPFDWFNWRKAKLEKENLKYG